MVDIIEKYNNYIPLSKDGDIILVQGDAFISKCIRLFDKAYFTHSGLVMKKDNQLMILDSTLDKKTNGVEIDFLKNTLKGAKDFAILRPLRTEEEIMNAQEKVIEQGIDGVRYNVLFYAQFLLYWAFKIDDTKLTTAHAEVCSQEIQFYTDNLNIPEYKSEVLITPQYIYDNINPTNIKTIIDKG